MTSLPELKSCELLPCPFCGVKPIMHTGPFTTIACDNSLCEINPCHDNHRSIENAIQHWNQRTPSPHNKECWCEKCMGEIPVTGDAVTREDTGCAGTTDATFSASAVTTSPTTIEDAELREELISAAVNNFELTEIEKASKAELSLCMSINTWCGRVVDALIKSGRINHAMKGQRDERGQGVR